jgi:hypothetical protein
LCGGYSGGDGFAVEQWGQDACGEVRARTDPGRGQFRKGQVRSERRDRRERGYQDSRQRKGPQAQDDRPGRDPNSDLFPDFEGILFLEIFCCGKLVIFE